MAVNMFLKLNSVAGKSENKVHLKENDVPSWSWGMANSGSAHAGEGARNRKVNAQDGMLSQHIDSSSPKFMPGRCNGTI